jgi:hypothetical protein
MFPVEQYGSASVTTKRGVDFLLCQHPFDAYYLLLLSHKHSLNHGRPALNATTSTTSNEEVIEQDNDRQHE